MPGLRTGALLELGFDDVSPNTAQGISSWVYDHAAGKVEIIDNRAKGVACYDPGYTFVEKLQTISTKFRKQQEAKDSPLPFMRHYYDVFSLLKLKRVQDFIGTKEYVAHKKKRFRDGDNKDISKNEAFILSDPDTRKIYEKAFTESAELYYADKPTLEEVLAELKKWLAKL